MGKEAGSVKGTALGIGCTAALVLGIVWFIYWVSHGDLVAVGVTVALSVVGGAYTLRRPGHPTFPPARGDGRSRPQGPAAAVGHTPSAGAPVAASRSVIRLASLLTSLKGYKPVEPAEHSFGFIGRTRHWGSHAWIALVDADELDVLGIEGYAKRFYDLVWNDVSLLGMGSYGVLCFVFEDTPSPRIVEHIRSLKQAAYPAKGNWMVYWTIDLATDRVISHAGPPWGLYPGSAYLEKAIRSYRRGPVE